MKKLPNSAKTLIVSFFLILISQFFFLNFGIAETIKKIAYSDSTCEQTSFFRECLFDDGRIIRGGYLNVLWHGNVYVKYNNIESGYYFVKDNKIRYGIDINQDGYYVGDLNNTSIYNDPKPYGYGTYYYSNGERYSFQNWQRESKIGYKKLSSGNEIIGIFDRNFNNLTEITLDYDFSTKLEDIVNRSREVKENYFKNYTEFVVIKNKSDISNLKNVSISTSSNDKYISGITKKTNEKFILKQNIIVFGILILIFSTLFIISRSSKKQTKPKVKETRYKFENLSYVDTRKILSFGVKEHMSIPEACKQLRSEYFRWQTVSNDNNAFKKTLSKKNSDEIIRLRNKLKC